MLMVPAAPRAASLQAVRTRWWIAALVVFLLHAFGYLYYFVDDEGIPFVIAQNVLDGHGPVYNAQDGHVEGYSDFVHVWLATAILAAVQAVGASRFWVFFVGKAVSLAFGAGIIWLTAKLLNRLGLTSGPTVLAGLGFAALAGPLAVWSMSSLETVQFAFVVLVLAYALCDDSGSWTSDAIAAVAASVLVLDRIDGFVYVGAVASAFLLVATSERRAILVRRVVGPAVVVFAAYHAWRVAYYHAILTPAITAKVLFKLKRSGTSVVKLPAEGYAVQFFSLFAWTPAIATVLTAVAATHDRRATALAVVTGLLTVYVAVVGDWMFGFRFFVALIPLFGVMIAWIVQRVHAWREGAGWALAACAVAALGYPAYGFERSYESYQQRPNWLLHPHQGIVGYFPFYDLQRTLRQIAKPGDTLATNLGGFVPFMVNLPNIDNLGTCTQVFAELPTTDVIFTEVGRYSPMTSKPVLRASDAYLMYRAPTFIAEPGDWMQKANHGGVPSQIFGGRYRLFQEDRTAASAGDGGAPWTLYVRATSLDEFRTHQDRFLENLVHVSSVMSVQLNGYAVSPSVLLRECPYLREEEGTLAFTGKFTIDMQFGRTDVPVYELYVDEIRASAPVRMEVVLESTSGPVFRETLDVAAGQPLTWFKPLPAPVQATRAHLIFSTSSRDLVTVGLGDVRVQGQTRELADFIAHHVPQRSP